MLQWVVRPVPGTTLAPKYPPHAAGGVADRAQLAVMESLAHGDAHRIEAASEHVAECTHQLRQVALMLDRVLGEPGDPDGLSALVEGALRLAATV